MVERGAIRVFSLFMIGEFVLLAFSLLIMGAWTQPLPLIQALTDDLGITVNDLAIGISIIGLS